MTALSAGRVRGLLLVAAGSLAWSTAGLFMRGLSLDLPTVVVWRSGFGAVALALIVLTQHGRGTGAAMRELGWAGLLAIPLSAVSIITYVASLSYTTVANVMTVYATVPFVAAAIGYLWLGEQVKRRVILASLVAFLGILIIAGSATRPADVTGNALAFVMTLTFSVLLVMARRFPRIDMAIVNAGAAILSTVAVVPFAAHTLPAPAELLILAGFGFTTTAVAYLLVLRGGRLIPSSEAGLVAMLDVVFGPLWVWLAYREEPGQAALVGGVFVLAAVVWYLVGEIRDHRAGSTMARRQRVSAGS